ncbi:MAG: hypothetical protein KatS3mg035_0938 [Bacteroidia bacterium]|nr:MAG: hypothetical protein KatS3mg035_0938 [Bacteroidia bacterium]
MTMKGLAEIENRPPNTRFSSGGGDVQTWSLVLSSNFVLG